MEYSKFPIVILAGGPTPEAIIEAGESEPERAFIDINGHPMLQLVIDAVRSSDIASEMVVIGNASRLKEVFNLTDSQVLEQGSSMLENLFKGMEHFRSAPRVMQMTCDIPLLTAESLQHLAEEAGKFEADIYYPIIDVKHFDEKFEGGKRTTQTLKEGKFTGGNVFIFNPEVVIKNRAMLDQVIQSRKSPAKLVKLLGFSFVLKFALKQLDIKGLETKVSDILKAEMRAIITPYPEIGFDVDKPTDLTIARSIVEKI